MTDESDQSAHASAGEGARKAHPGCERVEAWLKANKFPCAVNGVWDEDMRHTMRHVIEKKLGVVLDEDVRHRVLITHMAQAMDDPYPIAEVFGAAPVTDRE